MMTTQHSIERAKDRIGMNPRAAEHFMRNALERGKDKTMFTCEQKRRWLIAKEDACGYKALVYNDMCVIVSQDDRVITLYEVPGWFRRSTRYSGKERIRNQAKFAKFNRCESETNWVM
jgi:hypothetical protein